MPNGVNDQFLRILKNETKSSIRAIVLALALVPIAYFMAELTDDAFLGIVVWVSAGALAIGIALGLLWGRHETRNWNESLRQSWNAWMRMSSSCARIDEVARHVRNKRRSVSLRGAATALLILLNGVLFAMLWAEASFSLELGAIVTGLNGIVLGFLAGHAVWNWRWTAQFSKALDDLISEGSVGLWGEV